MKNILFALILSFGSYTSFGQQKDQNDVKSLCETIEISKDDFTGIIRFKTPPKQNRGCDIIAITDDGAPTKYYLYLTTYGTTANVGENGVKILLRDGTIIEKDTEVDIQPTDNSFIYSAMVSLNIKEVVSLSKTKIDKFRLYIYDQSIEDVDSEMLCNYMNCILDKT
jgi:hypothetical protein